jgi:hypothetical protein
LESILGLPKSLRIRAVRRRIRKVKYEKGIPAQEENKWVYI